MTLETKPLWFEEYEKRIDEKTNSILEKIEIYNKEVTDLKKDVKLLNGIKYYLVALATIIAIFVPIVIEKFL